MSRIYFHTQDEEAEIRGSERAWMGGLLNGLSLGILKGLYDGFVELTRLRGMLPEACYLKNQSDKELRQHFPIWFCVPMNDSDGLIKDGEVINCWTISLNTGLALRGKNDCLALFAKLHGQCEIHGYFLEDDYDYLKKAISAGLECGMYRTGQGWEDLLKLLETAKGPIVTSYSVCDSFPNQYEAEWKSKEEDDWYELPSDERWKLATDKLLKDEFRRMSGDYSFGAGKSAFDFI